MRKWQKILAASTALTMLAVQAQAAVVATYGQGYTNPKSTATNPVAVEETYAAGDVKQIVSTIAVNNGDSATSIYYVGTVPTNAVLDPMSTVYSSGITGLTSMSFGFGAPPQPVNQLTWSAQPSALVSNADWHTAGSYSLVSAVSAANYGEKVWQLLGLSLDPGGVVAVYATVNNASTQAGTLQFFVKYDDSK